MTGLFNRSDEKSGAEGTMVKIATVLYAHGLELDPENPPQCNDISLHDTYANVPVIFHKC